MSVDLGAAMLARLEAVGPTYYAQDYAAINTRGRHSGCVVEDSAESDGAASKLADELAGRYAFRTVWYRGGVARMLTPLGPRIGRHRAHPRPETPAPSPPQRRARRSL